MYEQEHVTHRIDPLEFEAHKKEWEKNSASPVFAHR